MAQSTWVADQIQHHAGISTQLVAIRSMGDDLVGPLSKAPQPGIFVSALRDALLAGDVDLVVHSMKDLPVGEIEGITLVAVPIRENPSDVFVGAGHVPLESLPVGSRVGTSSPRRAAQIRRFRPDLEVVDLRGNIDSRIDRVRSGGLDGAVLAAAGILRIGRANEIDGYLDQCLPAPAQGALAVEVRSGDHELIALLRNIDDPRSRRRVTAERAVLLGLAATCASAVAALATESDGDRLTLLAELGSPDKPEDAIRVEVSAVIPLENEKAATDLGLLAARIILARGGSRLLEHETWKGVTATPHTVWITRPATGARVEADVLRARGLSVIESPLIDTRTDPSASASARRVLDAIAGEADLLALTSAAAVRALVELTDEQTVLKAITAGVARGLVVATVGLGTAGEIRKLGATEVVVPEVQDSAAMLKQLENMTPGIAVLPRGNIAMKGLLEGLVATGWQVQAENLYLTETVSPPPGMIEAVLSGAIDAVVLRSPSGVRALRDAIGSSTLPEDCVLVAGGSTTARYIQEEWPSHGARVVTASAPSPSAVAEAVIESLKK